MYVYIDAAEKLFAVKSRLLVLCGTARPFITTSQIGEESRRTKNPIWNFMVPVELPTRDAVRFKTKLKISSIHLRRFVPDLSDSGIFRCPRTPAAPLGCLAPR